MAKPEVANYTLFLTKLVVIAAKVFTFCAVVDAVTDPKDVEGLQYLYISLNRPPQLTGWKSSGGDPCGESWKGVTCQDSSVVSLQLSGLELNGTMGFWLNYFVSLKTLDLSNNNLHDSIPYSLPSNAMILNLASNNFTGTIPFSIYYLGSISYLNISRNFLSGTVRGMLASHSALATLDISFNNFTGDLPYSFASMKNLSNLQAQNNQLTGSLNVLVSLPLKNLNVANNHFTGWIPQELSSIPNLVYGGNAFANSLALPPSPYTSPPPGRSNTNDTWAPLSGHTSGTIVPSSSAHKENKNTLSTGSTVGIALGLFFAIILLLLAVVFYLKTKKKKEFPARPSIGSPNVNSGKVNWEVQEQRSYPASSPSDTESAPAENVTVEGLQWENEALKRLKYPINVTSYTVADLQIATNNFSQVNLIGEGSLGRVYRAEFPRGKIMAIKKVDNAALSLTGEDNILEAVSNMSRLRHPNIVRLAGYCVEHGQCLLVHDYIANGSLRDMLHLDDERNKKLTWNARLKVALGTARALEYLYEVCAPSVVLRNLKSANILLDEELNPHLSDCGLAALTPNTEREVSSAQSLVSFGYCAPEYAIYGTYTAKSDVYSFGVVMLELLTGRKPLDSSRKKPEKSLVKWASPQLHDIDALEKMVDPALDGMYPARALSRFAGIIALCIQPKPEVRPHMSEVVQALARLMQRGSTMKTFSQNSSSILIRNPDHEAGDM